MIDAETIIELIATELDVDKDCVTLDSFLIDLGADSVHFLEIVKAIEIKFGVKIPDAAQGRLFKGKVSDLIAYIQKRARN